MEQQPSVGRIVHFVPVAHPGVEAPCQAAIVTGVDDGTVSLTVFAVHSSTTWPAVEQSEPVHQRGTWHWPERV